MKVLYITNLTTPYRIDFFNELGKLCELTVLVESVAVEHRNQDWLSRVKATNFKIYCLPGFYKGKEIRLNYGLTSSRVFLSYSCFEALMEMQPQDVADLTTALLIRELHSSNLVIISKILLCLMITSATLH